MHVVETPFESKEITREKYCASIKACNDLLKCEQNSNIVARNDVERIVKNFVLALERKNSGKRIKVFVEQEKILM